MKLIGRHRQFGFSIVELLVVAGIGSVLSLVIATLYTDMQRSENNLKMRFDGDNLIEEMRASLSSEKACINSFAGLKAEIASNHDLTSLRDGTTAPGKPIYTKGSTYGDRTITLDTLTLKNYQDGVDPYKGTMTLVVRFTTAKESSGSQILQRNIHISLEKDTGNIITSCVALSEMNDDLT